MAIEQENEYFLEKQIDVKRQMTSIKEIKETLIEEISLRKRTSFGEVFEGYSRREEEISPALCFLTLLHLANEKNLSFESVKDEGDFLIKLPSS